jgi:hypothetical protein
MRCAAQESEIREAVELGIIGKHLELRSQRSQVTGQKSEVRGQRQV